MKNIVITMLGLVMLAGTAQAHHITTTSEKCEIVKQPVYGHRTVTTGSGGDAGEGALAGMIIGGILGKGVSGNDKGAAAGAVIGGIIGADKAQDRTSTTHTERYVIRYDEKLVCRDVITTHQHTVVNVIPVGKTGPITAIYRFPVKAPGAQTCTWEQEIMNGQTVDVQVCRQVMTTTYRYELIVTRNGREYRDFTLNGDLQVGDYWIITSDAVFN